MVKKIIFIITFFISFVYSGNIEQKISMLHSLPKDKKYILMNEIKRELAKMNAAQRAKALEKLRASMHSSKNKKMHKNRDSHKEEANHMEFENFHDMKHMICKGEMHKNINKHIKQHHKEKKEKFKHSHGHNRGKHEK